MSSLFSKSALQQAISATHGHDLSEEIAIVNELYKDYLSGNTNDETRYEQRFNNLFFWQLLWYEENIHRHPKASTPVGSKIADVWLGFFEEGRYTFEGVKVVVELKWSGTLLDKKQASYGGQSPVDQGFGYKTSFKDCPWLLVSNFASLRLYRDNKQDFEVWTLEQLVDPSNEYYHLRTLLGLLRRSRLISQSGKSYTETLLSEVRINQETITKKFYKEYKTLRFELINDIRYLNPETHVETVVEKAQKIIDRIIFIHFCEDKGLLPEGKLKTNVIRAREADFSPWDVLKKYFKWVDSGSDKLEIPHGYNGGLFHTDPVLNDLEIGDAICHKFIDLGNYSFDDELSVNILGHIFEQSISDIEQLKGELLGEEITTDELVEKKESKRKKDGIFYTPEYIVDYIVQNSLMKYLEEKETACLEKVGKKWWYKTEIEAYQAYQHILQNIKVLDPACGSGAFLVKVFDYLYAENKRVGQIVKSLFDDDEIYKSILRNNIYGVDLNPESVEITKLSLWLKSAQKGKKLNNLDDNIKCGNSLIDDPTVAGERAFDWQKGFSDIMGAWGFDVIVGNPPYVTSALWKWQKSNEAINNFYKNNYAKSASYKINLYLIFVELVLRIIKNEWIISFIIPNTIYLNYFYSDFRKYLIENYNFSNLVNLDYEVFQDANIWWLCIFSLWTKKKDTSMLYVNNYEEFLQKKPFTFNTKKFLDLPDNKITFYPQLISIWNTCIKNSKLLWNQDFQFYNWIKTWNNDKFISQNKETNNHEPVIRWKDFYKYTNIANKVFVLFDKEKLRSNTNEKMFLVKEKIIIRQTSDHLVATYDNKNYYTMDTTHIIFDKTEKISMKYLLTLINSRLLNFLYQIIVPEIWKAFSEVKIVNLKKLPIKDISLSAQQPFIEKADLMLSLNKELHDKTDFFLRYISSKFWLEKLSTKLQKFHDYDFATFLKELNPRSSAGQRSKLSMTEEAELMEFFETKKLEIVNLKNKIDATDREIDEMVYNLYWLNDEEKKIVEGN